MSFQLNLAINPADLQALIDEGQQIVLVKSTLLQTSLAWLCLPPSANNCIQWDENYYIYAQMERVEIGTQIRMDYQSAVVPGLHNFRSFGSFFPAPNNNSQPDSYSIENQYTQQPYITLGLAQPVRLNGSLAMVNPMLAYVVFPNNTITFRTVNQVTIYMSNTVTTSQLISNEISTNALSIDFNTAPETNIVYDPAKGGFVLAGL
jgi:hypothetical protein